jgi:hypothetical protein
MLFTVQLLHTLIAGLNFACLFYITWVHWTRRGGGRLLRFAYWAIAIEAIAIIPFGLSCPIAHFVDHVWGREAPDILLPKWFSRWLIEAGVWLFVFAMVPPTVRWNRRRNLARAGSESGEGVAAPGHVGLPVAAPDET